MTCIVGVVNEGKVHIGGDNLLTGWTKTESSTPKVGILESHDSKIVYGVSGSMRATNVIQNKVKIPERLNKPHSSYIFDVVEVIRKSFSKYNASYLKSEVENSESHLILGYEGRMYKIQSDFSYFEVHRELAIGSGQEVAIGALLVNKNMEVNDRIKSAIQTASLIIPSVGNKVTIVSE